MPHDTSNSCEKTHESDLFRAAINALPHAFYVIDAQTYKIQIANSATEIFGPFKDGVSCFGLTHKRDDPCDGEEHICPLLQVKMSKEPVQVEHIHYDRDGNPRYYEVHAYPILDECGDVRQMIEYSLDITERKAAEEALQRAHDELGKRVEERTMQLDLLNKRLMNEITEHQDTEFELLRHQEKLKRMAAQLTVAEDEQRRQLATDLHDSIGQSLAALQIKLSEIRNAAALDGFKTELDQAFELLESIVQETRTLTFELSPPLLYEIGLEAAVEWLAETFQERYHLNVLVRDDGEEKPLSEKVRPLLFRIIRELLLNVVKHAQAHGVIVSLKRESEHINITIVDDGIGFDQSEKNENYGLFSIRERLEHLGGDFFIHSKPGGGTTISISAPLEKRQRKNIRVV